VKTAFYDVIKGHIVDAAYRSAGGDRAKRSEREVNKYKTNMGIYEQSMLDIQMTHDHIHLSASSPAHPLPTTLFKQQQRTQQQSSRQRDRKAN
jgi:hypothetical protein